jgi:hypothetical protein
MNSNLLLLVLIGNFIKFSFLYSQLNKILIIKGLVLAIDEIYCNSLRCNRGVKGMSDIVSCTSGSCAVLNFIFQYLFFMYSSFSIEQILEWCVD